MTDDQAIYCLDTSALINPWNGYYAPDLVHGYWRDIPRLVREGRVVISEEVREEVSKEDDLKAWARDNITSIVAAGFTTVEVVPGGDVFAGAPQASNAAAYGTRGAGIQARR